jgi:hypothetical protein
MVLTGDMQASSKEKTFDLHSYLAERRAKVEAALDHSLPPAINE